MKKYRLVLILFLAGIACMVTYNIIGCEIAPDGTLMEPFFLIPLSYLFMAISIILGIAVSAVSFFRKPKAFDK
jgi:hypothetical protein